MFRRSRHKIVLSIMAILALLFLGTLIIIYGSSYLEVYKTNREMLKRYVELYSLENQPGDIGDSKTRPLTIPDLKIGESIRDSSGPHFENTPEFRLSTFYSVAVSDSGEILAMDNDGKTVYDDAVLQEYAAEIIESQKDSGIKKGLIYVMEEKEGYTVVAFMDNTITHQRMTTLFRYTLIFGSITIVFLFFVARYLAGRIVKPLEESYQKQKQFISDAGHELKTPVSVISANAELLSREIGDNQWLSNIQYENERMGNLVGQLLELARTESAAMQTERLDISRLAAGEALPFESVAFEKGCILKYQIEQDLFVEGNRDQLKRLICIFLDNAVHYSDGGEVLLLLQETHGFARFSVINDGEEISLEQRKHLFERFYRADTARSGEDKHYGLGLAIAEAIVAAHKGKIDVLCYEGKVEFAACIPQQKK